MSRESRSNPFVAVALILAGIFAVVAGSLASKVDEVNAERRAEIDRRASEAETRRWDEAARREDAEAKARVAAVEAANERRRRDREIAQLRSGLEVAVAHVDELEERLADAEDRADALAAERAAAEADLIDVEDDASALWGAVDEIDAARRAAAAEADRLRDELRRRVDPSAVDLAAAPLGGDDPRARRDAIALLGRMIPLSGATDALAAAARTSRDGVEIDLALATMGDEASELAKILAAAETVGARRAACSHLNDVAALVAVLDDPNPSVRAAAVTRLGALDARTALDSVRARREDAAPEVRTAVAFALARLGAIGDVRPLLRDAESSVRRAALAAHADAGVHPEARASDTEVGEGAWSLLRDVLSNR